MTEDPNRRLIKSRERGWAKRAAAFLAQGDVSPDTISFIGLTFAFLGAAALALSGMISGLPRLALLLVAIVSIQLRLLANMLDGMVAVEHGKGGPYGPIWNELPDRIADALLLAGAGYGAFAADFAMGPALGWFCAVLAVMTAYVRELGGRLGLAADFCGPLAKPQRMGVLTIATALSLVEGRWFKDGSSFYLGLAVIAALTLVTLVRRVMHLARALKQRAAEAR